MSQRPVMTIVGGGHAGAEIAVELRKAGYDGRVLLVTEEASIPYQRPPLSKSYLLGKVSADQLVIRPERTYLEQEIEMLAGTRVSEIDSSARKISLNNGSTIAYQALALATGGRPRPLPLLAAHGPLNNVQYLRSLADADRLRSQWGAGQHAVVIGGGYIGLEIASSAHAIGLDVTVVEAMPRVLARVAGSLVSQFCSEVHGERGVALVTGASVVDVTVEAGSAREVVLADGRRLSCDVLLVGIGLIPNTELAGKAGLLVNDGVLVDKYCRTSDEAIVAAGDCTRYPSPHLAGELVRVESVSNAVDQARVAARTMLGQRTPHTAVPWFWSDQYEFKLQMVGLPRPSDHMVVRGDVAERSFSAFHLRNHRVVAADVVGRPMDFAFARQLVTKGVRVDRDQLADPDVPLKQLVVSSQGRA